MVIFRQTQGPVDSIISGGKGPVIPFLLQDRETGKVKVNTGLIRIITGLNKIKNEIKTFQEIISFFT